MTVEYLAVRQVLALHEQQLQRYGGATGVRDRGALESALARPAATFGGEDLYPDIADKAAWPSKPWPFGFASGSVRRSKNQGPIVATARDRDAAIITKDKRIRAYAHVRSVWWRRRQNRKNRSDARRFRPRASSTSSDLPRVSASVRSLQPRRAAIPHQHANRRPRDGSHHRRAQLASRARSARKAMNIRPAVRPWTAGLK